ncbi:MAG: hypothetical protein BHV98_06220 [Clostridium sp. CAG:217_53_7]|nr:MAG: hypothetical protein BHV98_06220 [Clostridium sp. CAG:217_53_7]
MLQLVFGRSGYGKTEYIRNRIADMIDRGETQVLLITPFDVSPFRAFVMNATVCTAPTAENC